MTRHQSRVSLFRLPSRVLPRAGSAVVLFLVVAGCAEQSATTSSGASDSVTEAAVVEDAEGHASGASTPAPVSGEVEEPDPTSDEAEEDQRPGSSPFPEGQVLLAQELAVLGGSRDDVLAAVEPYEGVITVEVSETDTYQVAFPVESLDQLLEIQAALQADGLDVIVVAAIDQP